MNIKKMVATSMIVSAIALGAQSGALAQPAAMGGPEGQAAQAQQEPPAAAPAQPSAAAPAAPAAVPNPQIVAFVDSQFPAADADKNGTLTAAEFTGWVSGLKTAELQKGGGTADPATVKSYADSALFNADKDKDGTLSKTELVTFFGG